MNGRLVLDTNAVIALVDGEVTARELIRQADEVYVPSPVLGELYFGAFHSARARQNIARVDDLVRWYAILRIDEATAKLYGGLRSRLRTAGTPIPDNDIWIAALAQQHGAAVATRDEHFAAVENLAIVRW